MGKIVKYCASCEESFAEKFSFCPNCAAGLTAYEMNPLAGASPVAEPVKVEEPVKVAAPVPEPVVAEEKEDFKTQTEPETAKLSANEYESNYDDILDVEENYFDKPETETIISEPKSVAAKNVPITILPSAVSTPRVAPTNVEDYSSTYKANGSGNSSDYKAASNSNSVKDDYKAQVQPTNKTYNNDGGYNITFVEEKNNGTRRGLLLAAFVLVTFGALAGIVTSLYTSNALVDSIGEDFALNSPIPIDAEVPPEEKVPEPPKAESKKPAGGGGGGGANQEKETSKGQLAPQMDKPLIAPSVTMDRVTKPAIAIQMATQGKAVIKQTDDPYGNPKGISTIPSDGTGSGGGQGSGVGRGQGSGRGTGAGSGIGSGLGSGIGNGIGGGSGSGIDGDPPEVKKPPVGPTIAIQITAKPRANYTDAARQAQVQGTVTLRVTFNANGSIGSISTVSGLPNGLTEQAIAAARGMRFEPAKKGGVPYTVTKQVQYNFTLY